MKKSGLKLDNYPNFINKDIVKKLNTRRHPLGNLSIYTKKYEPESWHEEIIASERYKDVMDQYSRSNNIPINEITPLFVMMNISVLFMKILQSEKKYLKELTSLAEKLIREDYNLSYDEVKFDLEIINNMSVSMPEDININKNEKEDENIDEDLSKKISKRRLCNALAQGAAKKGNYIFHMANTELENLIPGITDVYQKVLSSNDLLYYIMGDDDFEGMAESDETSGYVKIRFEDGIPVIEAKAINFPVLVHEVNKGVIELLALQGLPDDKEDAERVIEEADYLMAEIWDIRIGPKFWESLYSLINPNDYHIKKLILIDIFKLNENEFLSFFYDLLNNKEKAQFIVANIVKEIKKRISDYDFDLILPDIDFSDLGIG